MPLTRTELMPGVWLSHLRSDKFKTACLSVNLLSQLTRETAAMNALIPFVLRRGTMRHKDMEALAARFDELYGVSIEPVVRRIGEIQCVGFSASIPEDAFLPAGQSVLRDAVQLLGELLLSPATRGGLLLPAYVDSEREKLLETIRSRINEKGSYALFRCIEEMCCCEDFAVGRLGGESECEAIRYKALTRRYHDLLRTSPVEIFYCGRAEAKTVVSLLREALATLPRGEIDDEIGTDVRMNALEAEPRSVEEPLPVTQGKLVIGWRLGESMEDPDPAALYVFNAVYGGSSGSKLFLNVREKLHLCYYAGSMVDTHKGLLLVSSGVDFADRDAAQAEIFAQLEAIRRGEISEEELRTARSVIASELRMLEDSQGDLESFYIAAAIDGPPCSPAELAELSECVSAEKVREIAENTECDMIYFLTGDGTAEEAGADAAEEAEEEDGDDL